MILNINNTAFSTHHLSLTEASKTLTEYCFRIVDEAEEAKRAVNSLQAKPRGQLLLIFLLHVLEPSHIGINQFCSMRQNNTEPSSLDISHYYSYNWLQ